LLPVALDEREHAALARHHESCVAARVGAELLLDEGVVTRLGCGLELPGDCS
jgi:hypothetical protein